MNSNIARRVIMMLMTVFIGTLSFAQAAGALEFGQSAPVEAQGGAHEFGQ